MRAERIEAGYVLRGQFFPANHFACIYEKLTFTGFLSAAGSSSSKNSSRPNLNCEATMLEGNDWVRIL